MKDLTNKNHFKKNNMDTANTTQSPVLQIQRVQAISAYNKANQQEKTLLENLFGKERLLSSDISELINGWEDILLLSGRDAKEFELRPGETDDELAYREAKLVALVYNGGKIPEAMNTKQNKYFPWHQIDKNSGFGLAYDDYDGWDSISGVGVRLCFLESKHAVDAGKKFLSIYSRLKIK